MPMDNLVDFDTEVFDTHYTLAWEYHSETTLSIKNFSLLFIWLIAHLK